MNIRQLQYFLAVAQDSSIAKASKRIHISQPSISVQIKGLESELGVQLFERSPAGVSLTPQGTELLLHARGVMAALEAARSSVRNLKLEPEGPVGVGIPGSLAGLFTAPLVALVAAQFPAVLLRIVGGLSGHTRAWMLDGRLDLGLVYDSIEEPDLQLERLFAERLYLVAPRDGGPWLRRRARSATIQLKQLASVPLVLPGPGYAIRGIVDNAAAAADVRLRVAAEVDAIDQMVEVVARIGYCSIMSVAALQGSAWREQVVSIPIAAPAIVRSVALAHARHRPLTLAAREVQKIFRQLILQKAAEDWWAPSIEARPARSDRVPF